MPTRRAALLVGAGLAAACVPRPAHTPETPPAGARRPPAPGFARGARLQLVASFADRQITGIAVSRASRIFVCLPRWSRDVPVSVAELTAGNGLRPLPDEGWNAWRSARPEGPEERFVCAQGLVADAGDHLWVLDSAAPDMTGPVPGGAKLVRLDLRRDAVSQVIPLGAVAPPGSVLNDLRLSPDGRTAYVTDSGARGAIVVVDTRTGAARRALDGHPSTQPEPEVVPICDGQELRHPDGRPMRAAAHGIAVSADGSQLYWKALTGRTLYRLSTAALRDPTLTPDRLGTMVERVGQAGLADGLLIDAANRLFLANPGANAVEMAPAPGAATRVLAQDSRLRWPDTLAQGPDGALYVTASHIQDSPWFNPRARATPSSVWRILPA